MMTGHLVIGHDPGNSGALVYAVDGELVAKLQLTTIGEGRHKRLNLDPIKDFLGHMPTRTLFISEDLWGSEINTPTANWKLSQAESAVNTLARLRGFKMEYVIPQTWQKAILRGMPTNGREQIKKSAAKWAVQKYPELESALQVKARWDIADAACIGEYGLRLLKRGRI